MYHVGPQKFVRLADDDMRNVSMAPKEKFAIGTDEREYELMGNMDGRRFRDVYVVNPGNRRAQAGAEARPLVQRPSPDGESLLYYENGHFFVKNMASGEAKNITRNVPTSFINTEYDHNVVNPPTSRWDGSRAARRS